MKFRVEDTEEISCRCCGAVVYYEDILKCTKCKRSICAICKHGDMLHPLCERCDKAELEEYASDLKPLRNRT